MDGKAMKVVKPALEKVVQNFGSSFTLKKYENPSQNSLPFWHFHPELELVYVKGGHGKRHVGNHLSSFHDGDLIFLGSNLPHYGFTDRLTGNESEVVVQMKSDFLGSNFFELPEMQPIKGLFDRAKLGMVFHGQTKNKIGAELENLVEFDKFERLIKLLEILKNMAATEDYQLLNAQEYAIEVNQQDNERIREIYKFVRENYQRSIPLEEIAALVNMTVPAFCRYFKRLSDKTFTQFVNEFRIIHACKLLSDEPMSITEVAFECGFNNFSHFSKYFKQFTGSTPSAYRKGLRKIVN